jgi:thioredoxin 1
MTTTITSVEQFKEVTENSEGTLVVDFWAEWCGPCRAVSPILDSLEGEGKITVAKVNVDEQPELARAFNVTSIPLMRVYSDGKLSEEPIIGARPKPALEHAIQQAKLAA